MFEIVSLGLFYQLVETDTLWTQITLPIIDLYLRLSHLIAKK